MSKAFSRVWHKGLISEHLPMTSVHLWNSISRLLSDFSIAALVGGHCSLKRINSGVPQGSVLSQRPTKVLVSKERSKARSQSLFLLPISKYYCQH